jgi:hypothetical protein
VCRVNEARHKVNEGYLGVVLRMELLLLVELSKQELKHCLVTSTGLLVLSGMRNGTSQLWRKELQFICICKGALKLQELLSRITL